MNENQLIIENSLDRACYHEAAHLLIGKVFGLKYDHDSVAILIDWGKEHVTYIESEYKEEDKQSDIVKKLICSQAGQEIEKLIFGHPFPEGILSDNANIQILVHQLANLNPEINKDTVIDNCRMICVDVLKSNLVHIKRIVNRLRAKLILMSDEADALIPSNIKIDDQQGIKIEMKVISSKPITTIFDAGN
jgi:hypothetical protein